MEACQDSCASLLGQCRCLHRKRVQEYWVRSRVLLLSEMEPVFPWHRLFSCEVNCIAEWQEHPGVNQIRMHNVQISFRGEGSMEEKVFPSVLWVVLCQKLLELGFCTDTLTGCIALSQDPQGTSRMGINKRTTGNWYSWALSRGGGSLLRAAMLLQHIPCGMHLYTHPWWQS